MRGIGQTFFPEIARPLAARSFGGAPQRPMGGSAFRKPAGHRHRTFIVTPVRPSPPRAVRRSV